MPWRGGELWQQLGLGINANLPRMVDALMCYMHRIKHDGPNVLGLIDRLVAAFHQLITNQYSNNFSQNSILKGYLWHIVNFTYFLDFRFQISDFSF